MSWKGFGLLDAPFLVEEAVTLWSIAHAEVDAGQLEGEGECDDVGAGTAVLPLGILERLPEGVWSTGDLYF
jgi:hypothetical protein